jgi:hypothetical protein
VTADTKVCSSCELAKPSNEFHRNKSTPDGISYHCKACSSARYRRHYKVNSEAILERNRRWREENRESDLQAKRRRYQENREEASRRGRANRLRMNYGMTEADYEALLSTQGGTCAICRTPPTGGRRLHVDHDHEDGAVRGLLCSNCNRGIGYLRDDVANLLAAANYLVIHKRNGKGSPGDQYVTLTLDNLLLLLGADEVTS